MYIFNHIPKCAGSSYLNVFRQQFGADRILMIHVNEDREYAFDPNDYQTYDCIIGHFGVRWNDVIGPERRWLTALREPVDRVVSTYFYWRNNVPPCDISYVKLAKDLSLREFVLSRDPLILQAISNAQVWQLAEDLRVRYRSVNNSDALDVAKENLQKFDFVGLYDFLPQSMQLLCAYLKKPLLQFPHENATIDRTPIGQVVPSVRDAILDLNTADSQLYQYAARLFEERSQSLTGDEPPGDPGLRWEKEACASTGFRH
jgi:Sulfotransferase family